MNKYLDFLWVGAVAIWLDVVVPFMIPIQGYLIFMIVAIVFDTITGILVAIKQKKIITSRGIWRTIEKIVIAGIAIMLSEGFRILWIPYFPLTQGVSAIIAFAELKSNFENYKKITGVDIGTNILAILKDRLLPSSYIHQENNNTDETK